MKIFRSDRTCDIKTRGTAHSISFKNAGMSYSLYVDDEYRESFKPGSIISFLLGDINDYSFSLDGSQVVIAMRFGRMRVAVDGVYTDTGEKYRPVLEIPMWSGAFIVAIMTPLVVFRGTAFDYIAGVCCVYMCTHFFIKNPDLNLTMAQRIMCCVAVTVASWLIFGMFLYLEGKITF